MDEVRDDVRRDASAAIQITLWLEGRMPSGVATAPSGTTRNFTGWVGLMSAVDALSADGNLTLIEEEER